MISIGSSATAASKKEIGHCELLLKPVRAGQMRSTLSKSLFKAEQPTKSPVLPITKAKADPAKGELNLLVAEDNKTNQLVVKTMLKGASVKLTFANNGVEAVEKFQELQPDMIFMDMSMPEMDGVEAAEKIRALEIDQNIERCPIVALTANAMAQDRERCEAAGMDDFLAKPIKKAQLLDALSKWGAMAQAA